MTNGTGPATEHPPRAKMTIRVYKVGTDGAITQDRGTVASIPYTNWPLPQDLGYPPCACPWHRATETAVTR
ncbi:hypothetical protein ACWEQU_32785 [Streptomyces nodosus]